MASLINPGFLSTSLRIGRLTLGLRSLSSNDIHLLRHAAKEGGSDWPFYLAASSIWMIDGLCLLESHPYSFRVAYDAMKASHTELVRAIFSQALAFFNRMRVCNRVIEAFFYEDESRRLWNATNKGAILPTTYAGIPGVERLGLNSFQSAWIQWNRAEDDRENDDYSWSLTKVLVSVQSNKSAKKLDAKDKSRIENERTRRQQVMDRAFYTWKGVLDEEGRDVRDPRLTIHQPRTPQELAEEMRRWVAGEKDLHDLVVDDYVERIRREMIQREAEKQRKLEEAKARAALEEEVLGVQKPAVVAYTREQLSKLRPSATKPGAKFIIEGDPVSHTFDRYLREDPNSGTLAVEGGRIIAYKNPVTTPEESERPSLNDLIANRKPTFNG